jgi:hypothetical protein
MFNTLRSSQTFFMAARQRIRRCLEPGGVPKGVFDQLLSLHATIKSVFDAMTTDHARGVWA